MPIPENVQENRKNARVLVVDDMPVNRTILSSMLTTMGVSCDLAGSGSECLELCRVNTYDLILLDHRMPDMDGVETLMHLKELFLKNRKETHVICHTADEGKDYINLYKAAGFADVLIKPADPGQLTLMLMNYIPDAGFTLPEEEEKKAHDEGELASLPDWLKGIPSLDLMAGIKHCDSASDYLDALTVFTASIHEKANDIERFEREENWPMYLLRIHSLKSVATLVGANSLAEKASNLEYSGSQEEYGLIHALTPQLLTEYCGLLPQLERLLVKEEVRKKPSQRTVLFVSDEPGIVGRGISRSLEDEDFNVLCVKDIPEVVLNHRAEASVMIYYPSGDNDHIRSISTMLAEMCRDDDKAFCLVGNPQDLEVARDIHDRDRITAVYPRPVNLDKLATDICLFYDMHSGCDRTRTILVIDDDPDFLHIMENWLSDSYRVECAHSGAGALAYLDRKRPDLVLLDHDMPRMNGEQVMQKIRSNPTNDRVLIIFLTGRNDREVVLKILEQRPDGYLLKSMPREEFLDALQRFFAESAASLSMSASNSSYPWAPYFILQRAKQLILHP
ncbi:MAG: response regulator [Lachnospiraceae bacterium]|nr:response regulator [Lachnospiraceae bacterium]